MKKAYYIFMEEKNGKHFAFADSIKTEENLLAQIRRYPNLKGVFFVRRRLSQGNLQNNGIRIIRITEPICTKLNRL